jgi:hypothetical protein
MIREDVGCGLRGEDADNLLRSCSGWREGMYRPQVANIRDSDAAKLIRHALRGPLRA